MQTKKQTNIIEALIQSPNYGYVSTKDVTIFIRIESTNFWYHKRSL